MKRCLFGVIGLVAACNRYEPSPDLFADPGRLDLGEVGAVAGSSRDIVFANVGHIDLRVTGLRVEGDVDSELVIDGSLAVGTVLTPGQLGTVRVGVEGIDPSTTLGSRTASLIVEVEGLEPDTRGCGAGEVVAGGDDQVIVAIDWSVSRAM